MRNKILFILLAVALLVGILFFVFWESKVQIMDGPGMVYEPTYEEKHTEDFIRYRADDIYSRYMNPTYDRFGQRMIDNSINYDSVFCTSRYYALLSKALELTEENDVLFDYDHWTNSQDDSDFTFEVGEVKDITDSTAVVKINGKNFGKDCLIILSLFYERDEWYVDDFLPSDGGESEKAYLERIIREKSGNSDI